MKPFFNLTVAMATVTANQKTVGSNLKSKQDTKKNWLHGLIEHVSSLNYSVLLIVRCLLSEQECDAIKTFVKNSSTEPRIVFSFISQSNFRIDLTP